MFRQLVGLVLLSLAAFGLAPAQANSTDEAYILESPPILEVQEIKVSGGSSRAEPLQPTFSGVGNRVFYELKIDALTNGELDNFDVVAACFFTSSVASRASERDSLCGYGPANPTTPPSSPNPSLALSMAWTTDGTFRIDGDNSHELGASTHSTFEVNRTPSGGSSVTLRGHRLNFQFALSHAAINESDWTVRVVGVSTPTPKDGDTSPPGPQRTELLLDTNCSTSYSAQLAGTDCGIPDYYGVSFFGGFSSSTNRTVDYGSINENSNAVVRNIPTGNYYANDLATLTISASDFTTSGGEDTIELVDTGIGDERNKKLITLACTGGEGQKLLSDQVQDFYVGEERSSIVNVGENPEAPKIGPEHQCELHYGFGAAFANNTYTNVVQIGIKDADLTKGPTTSVVEINNPTPPTP